MMITLGICRNVLYSLPVKYAEYVASMSRNISVGCLIYVVEMKHSSFSVRLSLIHHHMHSE